tara:strand:+ start:95519 stop:95926 length:408 start_codon:yes stop_codon:yes gene_type:complete
MSKGETKTKKVDLSAEEQAIIKKLRTGEIHVDESPNHQLPVWLDDFEVHLDRDSIEAMAYLQDEDLGELSKLLTYYLCELSRIKEQQDDTDFFNTRDMLRILRLMEFISKWQQAELKQLSNLMRESQATADLEEA